MTVKKIKAKCDGCKKVMFCDVSSMTNRVVQKNGDPKFYCYKCCFKVCEGKSDFCPHCCDYLLCTGKFKEQYRKWLEDIKGV